MRSTISTPDYVRIDGSFTEELRNDHDARTHLKEIVQSLQSAGKLSIVPLVDSAGILATLWQAGGKLHSG